MTNPLRRELVSLYDLYTMTPFTVSSAGTSFKTMEFGRRLGLIEICGLLLKNRNHNHPNVYRFKPGIEEEIERLK